MKRTYSNMSQMNTSSSQTSSSQRRGIKRKFSAGRGRATGRALSQKQKAEVATLIHRNQELKYFLTQNAATAVTTTGFGGSIDIPQGDTDTTRDGDQLMYCGNCEFNMQVVNGQGATADIYNNVRVIWYQWHPLIAPTGATDILLPGPSTAVDIYSQYNHDRRYEYKILFDKTFKTVGNGFAATTPNTNMVTTGMLRFKIPTKGMVKKSQFTGGTTTGTEKIFLFVISDSALATHPTLAYSFKTFFRDS